jgi:predicted TIM-barrel fold metal-dependent hydrolase
MLREWSPDVPNVWFDTGAMVSVAHGLEAFIDSCGAERLVFGTDFYSGSPHFRRAYPIDELSAMELSPDVLDLICNSNIRTLMRRQ